jgi:hypothetical protein
VENANWIISRDEMEQVVTLTKRDLADDEGDPG